MKNGLNVVCTNYEGDYDYGVGALINSLFSIGYEGKVVVLYGDFPPFWQEQLIKKNDKYVIAEDVNIEILFRKIESEIHLCYYKPFMIYGLMKEFLDHKIYYFDPDITVLGDWKFFENWVDCGVAMCLDQCYPIMPINHPFKKDYRDLFQKLNHELVNPNDYYVNSGFIGVGPNHITLIKIWMDFTNYLSETGHDLVGVMVPSVQKYRNIKRLNTICGDQDILNAALLYTKLPLSILGQEGMGFIPAGFTMNHAANHPKPWKKNYLKEFLFNGKKFSAMDQSFLNHISSPINLYSKRKRILININKNITKLLQRIL